MAIKGKAVQKKALGVQAIEEKQAQRIRDIKSKAKAANDKALRSFALLVLETADQSHAAGGKALTEDQVIAAVRAAALGNSSAARNQPSAPSAAPLPEVRTPTLLDNAQKRGEPAL